MPHCEIQIYHTFFSKIWNIEKINSSILLGNSFESYHLRYSEKKMKKLFPQFNFLFNFVKEINLSQENFIIDNVFNDTSLHFFDLKDENQLPPLWKPSSFLSLLFIYTIFVKFHLLKESHLLCLDSSKKIWYKFIYFQKKNKTKKKWATQLDFISKLKRNSFMIVFWNSCIFNPPN